ncbi:hypothetical protein ACFVS2_20595 [Brevibacillus sp. NPDC058079]|uniref:hypothetical protein n=1 Tax=Brevibacillus sp. NPDC058079 TaxID=3346330 RepID=UPI0036EA5F34
MFETETNLKIYEKKTVAHHRKNWYSEIKQSSDFYLFQGESLPEEVVRHPKFLPIISYLSEIFENAKAYRKDHLPSELIDEVLYYEQKGQLCVHMSIITYALLYHNNIADEKRMKYVQGYYHHETRTNNWIAGLMGNAHIGSHAWITIGKAVVDVSIKQEELFFDFGTYPIILGKVPSGMTLKGFTEPKKTVNKYMETFAKRRNVSIQEWIEYHNQMMEELSHALQKKTL